MAIFIKLLIVLTFTIQNLLSCPDGTNGCSGIESVFNPENGTCTCSENLWGNFCQYGRERFTSKTGYIVSSKDHYHCFSKHMYLIDSQRVNVPIRIYLNDFATECVWDHLYVYDGTSIYDPLIGVFSGVVAGGDGVTKSVTTYSGNAYLYFYSDANISDRGFNISYRISECASEICNNHGICETPDVCVCDVGWTGVNCGQKVCCNDVTQIYGDYRRTCYNCTHDKLTDLEIGRASHAAALSRSPPIVWVYGGYSTTDIHSLLLYNIETKQIGKKTLQIPSRYGHTMVSYATYLYVFGGKINGHITNNLKQYDIERNVWSDMSSIGSYPVTGHASVVVEGKMFVFFGFNEKLLLVDFIQELDLATKTWKVHRPTALVYGRFGHSATYDHVSNAIYIYGGYVRGNVTSHLLKFDVSTWKWTMLPQSSSPRMLHSAVIVGGNLIIYGGNAHDASSTKNTKNKCHSNDVLIYNIDCKKWIWTNHHSSLDTKGRYGHSAVEYNGSMYIFGGFDGTLKKDIFQIQISDDCRNHTKRTACLTAPITQGCVWSKKSNKMETCIEMTSYLAKTSIEKPFCNVSDVSCNKFKTMKDCFHPACVWDGKCDNKQQIQPRFREDNRCKIHSTCVTCNQEKSCLWYYEIPGCLPSSSLASSAQKLEKCFKSENITSCHDLHTCQTCLNMPSGLCMWCESENTCLDLHSYVIEFPYGQCLEWASNKNAHCQATHCESQTTCLDCFELPGCGWCDDGMNTGVGRCMKGSQNASIGNITCPASRWSFLHCPPCSCNGHSTCFNGTDICKECFGNVVGKHCDQCKKGYYGKPENNGTCRPCECNGHFKSCTPDGKCTCNMKGAIGNHCESCDFKKNVYGNSTNGGICYSLLSVDFEYTTNLTATIVAGFSGTPRSLTKDFKFEIFKLSGADAYLNLTIHYANGETTVLKAASLIINMQVTLTDDSYDYDSRADLRAIVYGWQEDEHFAFKISYSHPHQPFDLVYFLIMFLVCFCSLLAVLIVLWKVKQRYDFYMRSRQERHEQEERVNRPFKSLTFLLGDKPASLEKKPPTLIACEPLANEQLAISSFLLELPTDERGLTPPGRTGIYIGSVLTTMPHRRTFNHIQVRKRKAVGRGVPV